jgi:outer membrane protein assembly factor BamB
MIAALCLACAVAGFLLVRGGGERAERPPAQPPAERIPEDVRESEWPAFGGGGPLHSNVPVSLPLRRMELTWTAKVGLGGESAPVIAGGMVFVGGMDGSVAAFDLNSGARKWLVPTEGPVSAGPLVRGDLVLVGDQAGRFLALGGEAGRERWRFACKDAVHGAANLAGEHVLFGSYDSHVYCLEAATGALAWKFETEAQVYGTPAVSGGTVFVGGCDETLRALSLTDGGERWHVDAGGIIAGSPVCFGEVVCAASMSGRAFSVRTSDGSQVWEHLIENEECYGSPAFSHGLVVVPGRSSGAYGLDAKTGEHRWTVRSADGFDASPLVCGDGVYLSGNDGVMRIVGRHDGREIWRFTAGARLASPPAIAGGMLVICDEDGTLYALSPYAAKP